MPCCRLSPVMGQGKGGGRRGPAGVGVMVMKQSLISPQHMSLLFPELCRDGNAVIRFHSECHFFVPPAFPCFPATKGFHDQRCRMGQQGNKTVLR